MANQSRNTGTLAAQAKSNTNLTWDQATFTWNAATGTWDNPTQFNIQARNTAVLTSQTKH